MKRIITSGLEPYTGSEICRVSSDGRVMLPKSLLVTSLNRHMKAWTQHPDDLELAALVGYVPNWYIGGRKKISLFSASDLAHCELLDSKDAMHYWPRTLTKRMELNVGSFTNNSRTVRLTGRGDYISMEPLHCVRVYSRK
ncbi:MAG TPA: hypothetical protein VK158_06005 [Acidobacteriota bacterium]|nr:hypothetical protein [Acidobacteriota bacterium]